MLELAIHEMKCYWLQYVFSNNSILNIYKFASECEHSSAIIFFIMTLATKIYQFVRTITIFMFFILFMIPSFRTKNTCDVNALILLDYNLWKYSDRLSEAVPVPVHMIDQENSLLLNVLAFIAAKISFIQLPSKNDFQSDPLFKTEPPSVIYCKSRKALNRLRPLVSPVENFTIEKRKLLCSTSQRLEALFWKLTANYIYKQNSAIALNLAETCLQQWEQKFMA